MVCIEKKPSATIFFCYCSTISKRSNIFLFGFCIFAISFYFNSSTLRYFIAKFLFVSFKVRQIENVWVIKETAKSYFDCFAIHTLFKTQHSDKHTHTRTQFPFDWNNIEWTEHTAIDLFEYIYIFILLNLSNTFKNILDPTLHFTWTLNKVKNSIQWFCEYKLSFVLHSMNQECF